MSTGPLDADIIWLCDLVKEAGVHIHDQVEGSVLIDGVMTDHQIAPGSSSEPPTITITGEDLTREILGEHRHGAEGGWNRSLVGYERAAGRRRLGPLDP